MNEKYDGGYNEEGDAVVPVTSVTNNNNNGYF